MSWSYTQFIKDQICKCGEKTLPAHKGENYQYYFCPGDVCDMHYRIYDEDLETSMT